MKTHVSLLASVAVFVFAPAVLAIDVLTLKDGTKLEGTVVKRELGQFVTIRLPDGKEVTYPWSEIRRVESDPMPVPGATGAAPARRAARPLVVAPPPPKPPPREHDAGGVVRIGAVASKFSGNAKGKESRPATGSYYGPELEVGGFVARQVAVTLGGMYLFTDHSEERSEVNSLGVKQSLGSRDETGGGYGGALSVHVFPNLRGGLHLQGGVGYATFGDDDKDKFYGVRVLGGVGYSPWISDEWSFDLMLRAERLLGETSTSVFGLAVGFASY